MSAKNLTPPVECCIQKKLFNGEGGHNVKTYSKFAKKIICMY